MSNREIVVTQNYLVKKQTDKNPNFSTSLAKLCYEILMYFINENSYIIMRGIQSIKLILEILILAIILEAII